MRLENCSTDGLDETVVFSGLKNFNSSISGGSWGKNDNKNIALLKYSVYKQKKLKPIKHK